MKSSNSYQQAFGRLYARTPKAVFAAVAFSLAFIDIEEAGEAQAVAHFMDEWRVLHENGIVPQKPPSSWPSAPAKADA